MHDVLGGAQLHVHPKQTQLHSGLSEPFVHCNGRGAPKVRQSHRGLQKKEPTILAGGGFAVVTSDTAGANSVRHSSDLQ